jgi:hypothetical protein
MKGTRNQMKSVAVLISLLSSLAVLAPAAQAVEETGRGEAIEFVKNIPYPNLHDEGEVNAGTDLEFADITVDGETRTFSFAGSYGDGLHIIDVTDPENSQLVSTWDCGISQGDVQVFQRPDLGNRWFVTFTHDDGYTWHQDSQCVTDLRAKGIDPADVEPPADPDGQVFAPESYDGGGTYIADVTDPYNPKTVSFVGYSRASHNQTVHPSGKFLYNSNSDLITSIQPAVEIVSIEDIENPVTVGEIALKPFPGLGTESHDIVFSEDGSRAYVAALSHGEILDTTDPANPTSVGTVIDPTINVWHQMEDVTVTDPILGERTFLIAEDEVAGAQGTGQCPNGGVHVYDITGELEAAPVKVGYWNIDDVGTTEDTRLGTCTAHVFQIHEDEKLMTIAYYNGGVRVVDLSGLVGVALGKNGVGMKQLGWYRFKDGDTWAVKAPHVSRDGFYMYGNDHRRGFDVYKYAPAPAAAAVSGGTWLNAGQAAKAAKLLKAGGLTFGNVCLIRAKQLAG